MVFLAVVTVGVASGAGWLMQGLGFHLSTAQIVDAVTGAFCLAWMLILLKAPWDLYFESRAVLDEMRASTERAIPVDARREREVRTLSRRLLALAIFAHLASAGLAFAASRFSGGQVGQWFAVFFAVSTVFRPAISGYKHLLAWLREMRSQVRFPREDVLAMRDQVERHQNGLESAHEKIRELGERLDTERVAREKETRELREGLHSMAREFETTLSRVTDNQEVIRGIQAFVRLIGETSARTR